VSAPALLLALALSAAPTLREPFTWPMPDVLESIDLPGVSMANGVPVKLHILRTRRPAAEMLQRYATAFDRAGFYIPPRQKRRLAEPHLTALDTVALISHTVILKPEPDGSTTCILGEANLRSAQGAAQARKAPLLMPGAADVVQVQQEGSALLSFEVRADAEAVRRHYRERLVREGWQASDRPGEEDVFSRAEQVLQLVLREKAGGVSSVLIVQRG
jgi:hypothetical protein